MKSLSLLVLVVLLFATGVHGWFHVPRYHYPHHHGHAPSPGPAPCPDFFTFHKKIFVFGDSYADTGNSKISEESWKIPYGMTFPGHPSGRYSNGLVLTDFLARHFRGGVGLSPIPFEQWRKVWRHPMLYFGSLLFGINFAHGGTGVFDTDVAAPNMTAQIDLFEQLVKKHYGDIGMENSLAIVTNSGNDYSAYMARNNGTLDPTDVMAFIGNVTAQLGANMRRIQALGVKKILVANLALHCVPRVTKSLSYKQCDNDEISELVDFHNMDLNDQVRNMNAESANKSTVVVLDLSEAFLDILKYKRKDYGSRFPEGLKGCCMGTSSEGYCAVVDEKWKPMYTVCEDPQKSFFWDMVHPTEAGWEAVYERLLPALKLV